MRQASRGSISPIPNKRIEGDQQENKRTNERTTCCFLAYHYFSVYINLGTITPGMLVRHLFAITKCEETNQLQFN